MAVGGGQRTGPIVNGAERSGKAGERQKGHVLELREESNPRGWSLLLGG